MTRDLTGLFEMHTGNRKPIPDGSPVILYGAGNVGRDLCRIFRAQGRTVACFLDMRAGERQEVDGIPVFRPDSSKFDPSCHPVIISIFNRETSIPGIIQSLRRRGFTSVLTILDVYDDLAPQLGSRFWLAPKSYFTSFQREISDTQQLWADEKSRDLYARIVEFRLTGNYTVLPEPEPDQYFPGDVPPWSNPARFIDAGAYDGDSIRALAGAAKSIEAIAAFEPEPDNFLKLATYVRSNLAKLGSSVSLFPCGVWSRTEALRFVGAQGDASRIAQGEGSLIQCVALDDALPAFAPTLIKLDVEGSEYQALEGASRMIREHSPGLAVCLYHRPDDLWTIPRHVHAMVPDYRLYLRCHAYTDFELVLYAVRKH